MHKNVLGADEASRELAKRRMRDECRVLAELAHPHLIRMVEVCESPQCLFIVMERAYATLRSNPGLTASNPGRTASSPG